VFYAFETAPRRHGCCFAAVRFVTRTTFGTEAGPVNEPGRARPVSWRWVLSEQSLQMLPPVSRRSFKWSYIVARTLRKFHPGNYF